MFTCSADNTVLLLLRAEWVEQGGTWGIPGGGIGEGHFDTPMKPITDLAVFRRKAEEEVEEECGAFPPYMTRLPEGLPFTEYEDCGFRYVTFILDITKAQKDTWAPFSADGENDAFVWFPLDEVRAGRPLPDENGDLHDIHFGVSFTMQNMPTKTNPRRRNPAAVAFPHDAPAAQREAQAARAAILASAAFRRWFAGSHVVDARGEPLVVYHGTKAREAFTVFRRPRFEDYGEDENPGVGIYFTDDPKTAASYGSVYPVYLRILNPLVVDGKGQEWGNLVFEGSPMYPDDIVSIAEERGHDGVIIRNVYDNYGAQDVQSDVYVVFEPTQIKSATGNEGTFDAADPDIRRNPRMRRLRRNPEDRGYVLDLLARLQEFKENVMEAADVDPYDTEFDPMDYPIDDSTLQSYLDAPVLGWGASRVVVRLPSGNVAKLPWSDAYEANEREWDNWNEASPEVQEMLLPPLEYVSGVLVFPHAKTVHHLDYDDPALAAARSRWRELWSAGAPGASAQDFQNTQNWGIYDGRLVLLDYAD